MKIRTAAALVLSVTLVACARSGPNAAQPVHTEAAAAPPTPQDVAAVSPALARYTVDTVRGELWRRPDLSPRDRSIVTLAALIARSQTAEMPYYLDRALDDGVKPAEVSEVITHLAFYAGWGNAMSSVVVAKSVFSKGGIKPDQLPPATGELLPMDQTAEASRAARVEESYGSVAPSVVRYTTEILFQELWLRPALAPRDRSLVTVSALIASGQAAQLPYHLNRAMDYGLTGAQVSEVLTQLAFLAGWPSVFSSLPVVKEIVEKRRTQQQPD